MKAKDRTRKAKSIPKRHAPIPKRDSHSHKGQNGIVLVIGGSKDYVGAPALAGLAALRAGCDIVRIAAPSKAAWAINAMSPDLITVKLEGNYIKAAHARRILDLAGKSDAVILGPGMGLKSKGPWLTKVVEKISASGKKTIVDADALKMLKLTPKMKNLILTPHHGELEELLANVGKRSAIKAIKTAKSANEKTRRIHAALGRLLKSNVLLLKGHEDLVIMAGRSAVVRGGNPGMTVGGTGDILAGLCAGYAAQRADIFTAARLASTECKRVGDLLRSRSSFGFGFISSDFLRKIRPLMTHGQTERGARKGGAR